MFEGNTIQIDPSAFERHYFTPTLRGGISYAGDFLSTLLHAGFHLLSSAATAQITDTDLYEQTSRLSGLSAGAASGLQSAAVGAAFAKYCGADILQRYP